MATSSITLEFWRIRLSCLRNSKSFALAAAHVPLRFFDLRLDFRCAFMQLQRVERGLGVPAQSGSYNVQQELDSRWLARCAQRAKKNAPKIGFVRFFPGSDQRGDSRGRREAPRAGAASPRSRRNCSRRSSSFILVPASARERSGSVRQRGKCHERIFRRAGIRTARARWPDGRPAANSLPSFHAKRAGAIR